MKLGPLVFTLLAAMGLSFGAFAQSGPPHNTGKEAAYTRAGKATTKVPNHAVLATIGYVETGTGTQALKDHLFVRWDSIVHVESCGETTTFCFVQSVDDLAVDQHGFITDSASGKADGMCHGFSVGTGSRDIVLGRKDFYTTGIATREGYCYGSTDALEPYNGWPCDETVDCPGASVCYTWLHHQNRVFGRDKTLEGQIGGTFLVSVDADGSVTSNTCQIDTEK